MTDISIVAPVYNESESLDMFFQTVIPILKQTKLSFEILCINDGSEDTSLELLTQNKKKYPQIKIINFSRNFGKEAALTAGIDFSKGNCLIPIDCDLQDPPKLIIDMVRKWQSGFDVVLAKRIDRSKDTFIKRISSQLFYKVYNCFSDIELPENVGDFRLIDKKVIDILKTFPERGRFMKGLFSFVGFKTTVIEYKRPERIKGISKWSYLKLWRYALGGITSFSTFPLKITTYCGWLVTFFAFLRGLWLVFKTIFYGIDIPGYASQMVIMLFLGGIQLMSLGIIGKYIGHIYNESKQRPIYIVRDII
jgi:glycosyltransferase involved in cell wall biosynthesis